MNFLEQIKMEREMSRTFHAEVKTWDEPRARSRALELLGKKYDRHDEAQMDEYWRDGFELDAILEEFGWCETVEQHGWFEKYELVSGRHMCYHNTSNSADWWNAYRDGDLDLYRDILTLAG